MRFVDSEMGTGKTTAIINEINNRTDTKYICVVPSLSEVERYQKCLCRDKMIFLSDEYCGTQKKTDLFHQAIATHKEIIVTTHALFLEFLEDTFTTLAYELMMDEVPLSFQKSEAGWAVPSGLAAHNVIEEINVTDTLKQFQRKSDYVDSEEYSLKTSGRDAKQFLKTLAVKDIFQYQGHDVVFSMRLNKLSLFADVTILGYLYEHTDFWYWCRWKDIKVDHMTLSDDHKIIPHDGSKPSGKQFSDLVEVIREKKPSLKKGFSFNWQDNNLCPKRIDSDVCTNNLKDLRASLRANFKNGRDKSKFASNSDFIFVCAKDSIDGLIHTKSKLTKGFISEEKNWVYSTIRGTNEYSHKRHVAYLMNIHPFPPVEYVVSSLCPDVFDKDAYRETLALSQMIQALWRSAIRKGEKIRVYIPSERMADIFEDWLGR
ncbi:MAG: DEAD/DEAH box helicase family protein [Desulfocapsa sp.]|nr:DEAD/DEAH box helicase family protein [Desulfocapsa sp.]